ncbi:MAG: glutamate--tRNA ligase [Bacteroidetes bacterium]|nr:glutamate--tRNA ligase [Bacteroidota bacterium]MBU1113581.1 glutamate--tRNA ligase [Bacteroidota bacterium]MBU1796958.1 glutamate--tRNA ligase [Bacteroidota bacterium]
MINKTPRVRFAPSPTGYLHVGGLRTALYNYLFAKKNGGKFILRIEDTDQNRFVEGAVENLIETLNWVGLEYDEGPNKEGNVGPYFQSQRLDIYKKYADQLVEQDNAYRCFCSPERLADLKEQQQKAKLPQAKYDKHCLHLSKEEIKNNIDAGISHVIRLNVKAGESVVINDIVRDRVEFSREVIDDQILIKTDGYPTYHMANVVDDHLMGITHVIRGEEWLSSTPKHILLYNAFGWEIPIFAHLPLLLNADRSKLSKRQGDVAVEDYKSKGYLKEALINFVALLGWSTTENDEFFNLNDLIEKFTLERVHKAGAIFNVEKLDWINAEHLRKLEKSAILKMLRENLAESKYKDLNYTDEYLLLVIAAMLERVSFVKDYIDNSPYFFERPTTYDEEVIKKRWKEDSVQLLEKYIIKISHLENPKKEDFEIALKQVAEEAECGAGRIIHPLRVATSGSGIGPGVYDLLFILGKDEVIARINNSLEVIPEIKAKLG